MIEYQWSQASLQDTFVPMLLLYSLVGHAYH